MGISLYDNIRKRRKELGLTQSHLAERMHYADKSMIAKIEKGIVDLPQSRIEAFAKALHTTPAALMGWTIAEDSASADGNLVKIPLCTGYENEQPVLSDTAFELSVNISAEHGADFVLPMQDSDKNSQLIYVRVQKEFEDGRFYLFYYNNNFLLRRPYRYANGSLILLRSANAKEEDIEVTAASREQLHIVGKVIGIKSSMQ